MHINNTVFLVRGSLRSRGIRLVTMAGKTLLVRKPRLVMTHVLPLQGAGVGRRTRGRGSVYLIDRKRDLPLDAIFCVMTTTSPPEDGEQMASFDTLPVFVQSDILARLHWRDLLSTAMTCKSMYALAMEDEVAWELRCRERFRESELAMLLDDDALSTWKETFLGAVERASVAVRRATPLLTAEDNVAIHFRRFEDAQAVLKGLTFEDVREFIASSSEDQSLSSPPTLLVLAGIVECLARAPVSADPAEIVCLLRDAGLGSRKVRATRWLLGRLEGVGFRLRDEVRVHEGTLEDLVMNEPRVWEMLLRGIRHEVRDMEITVVGPPKADFWSTLGTLARR